MGVVVDSRGSCKSSASRVGPVRSPQRQRWEGITLEPTHLSPVHGHTKHLYTFKEEKKTGREGRSQPVRTKWNNTRANIRGVTYTAQPGLGVLLATRSPHRIVKLVYLSWSKGRGPVASPRGGGQGVSAELPAAVLPCPGRAAGRQPVITEPKTPSYPPLFLPVLQPLNIPVTTIRLVASAAQLPAFGLIACRRGSGRRNARRPHIRRADDRIRRQRQG